MHFLQYLIHTYGLVAVGAVVGLECVGFPLPGETALLAAAVYAGTKHDLNIVSVIITAAATAIDSIPASSSATQEDDARRTSTTTQTDRLGSAINAGNNATSGYLAARRILGARWPRRWVSRRAIKS